MWLDQIGHFTLSYYIFGGRGYGERGCILEMSHLKTLSRFKRVICLFILYKSSFFLFTSEMTSLLSSILWSSPNLVPTAPPPIFTEKPWGRGWSSPSRWVEGRGGGGEAVYATRSGLCVRHFVSFGLKRLATENVIGEITTEHRRI